MSYIGNQPLYAAFLTDQFSGNNSTVAFSLSAAPANTASILVAVSGVLQDPTTYAVSGMTLTFSAAPPTGTGNISVRYLGIPAAGVVTTAYRTVTEFTATAGQTSFTPPSYTVGFIAVYRNGVRLGAADYTASNGTTVVLASGANSGDLVVTESFFVSSVVNAIPNIAGAVSSSLILDGAVTDSKITAMSASKLLGAVPYASQPAGSILQVVSTTKTNTETSSATSYIDVGLDVTITPKFSTSKILITASVAVGCNPPSANVSFRLRNTTAGTTVSSDPYYIARWPQDGQADYYCQKLNFQQIDSPATTSATTYKIQMKTNAGSFQINMPANTGGFSSALVSTITLMEIAA